MDAVSGFYCTRKLLTALVLAEPLGLDDEPDTDGGMKFTVGEQTFSVAVVILDEEILIVAREDAVVEFNGGVVVQIPAFALDEIDS